MIKINRIIKSIIISFLKEFSILMRLSFTFSFQLSLSFLSFPFSRLSTFSQPLIFTFFRLPISIWLPELVDRWYMKISSDELIETS